MLAIHQRLWPAIAGLGFAAFPLIRPYGDKTGDAADAAAAFADPRWIASHGVCMLAFIALALALRARGARRSELGAWIGAGLVLPFYGAGLVLPFYGAETFGLHAVGLHSGSLLATAGGTDPLWQLASAVRDQPVAITSFALGLAALAAVGVGIAIAARRSRALTRVAAILVAAGLVTYLPQFFLPEVGRVIHGVILGVGLLLFALTPSSTPTAPLRDGPTGLADGAPSEAPQVARDTAPAGQAIPRPFGSAVGENGRNRTVERTNHG